MLKLVRDQYRAWTDKYPDTDESHPLRDEEGRAISSKVVRSWLGEAQYQDLLTNRGLEPIPLFVSAQDGTRLWKISDTETGRSFVINPETKEARSVSKEDFLEERAPDPGEWDYFAKSVSVPIEPNMPMIAGQQPALVLDRSVSFVVDVEGMTHMVGIYYVFLNDREVPYPSGWLTIN